MTEEQPTDIEKAWLKLDASVTRGDMTSEDAVVALEKLGLVSDFDCWYLSPGPFDEIGQHAGLLWVLKPSAATLVSGPRLILDMGERYGGPRNYQPLLDGTSVSHGDRLGPA